jgi:hypothetical protein
VGGKKHDFGVSKSAPTKIYYEKMKESKKMAIDSEEAIPSATCEPSDRSDDFQIQVNRVIGYDARTRQGGCVSCIRYCADTDTSWIRHGYVSMPY